MFITSFGEQNITYKCCSNFLIHLFVKVIESQKPKLIEQLALQENLFKTLQNKAFSGTL